MITKITHELCGRLAAVDEEEQYGDTGKCNDERREPDGDLDQLGPVVSCLHHAPAQKEETRHEQVVPRRVV